MKLAISLVVFSLSVSVLGNPTANHAQADQPTKPTKVLITAAKTPEPQTPAPTPAATPQPAPVVVAPTPEPTPAPTPAPAPTYSSDHNTLMAQAGIAAGDMAAADYIITKESGWRYWVVNSEGSGATGLCQALPGSKMATAGADYLTNPVTQLVWCNSYAAARYGGWWSAYNYWIAHHNW